MDFSIVFADERKKERKKDRMFGNVWEKYRCKPLIKIFPFLFSLLFSLRDVNDK